MIRPEDLADDLRSLAQVIERLCAHDAAEREWAELWATVLETIEDSQGLSPLPGFEKILHAIEALAEARLEQLDAA